MRGLINRFDGLSTRRHDLPRLLVCVAAISAAAVVLAGSAAARPAAASSEGGGVLITGNAPSLLYPGAAALSIDLGFSNPNDDSVSLSSLTVSVKSISAPNATAQLPCAGSNFAVTQFGGGQPFSVPPGLSTLQSLGVAQSRWPTLRMIETHQNQDGCEGATLTLSYSGSGQDGQADTTTSTTAVAGGVTPVTTTTTSRTPTTTVTAPPTRPVTVDAPSIALSPTTQTADRGATVMFGITVVNTSGVKLTDVTVTDPLAPRCDRSIDAMDVKAKTTYSCSRADVNAGFTNVVTVTGKPPSGSSVSASDHATVKVTAPLVPPPHSLIAIEATPLAQTLSIQASTRKSGSSTVLTVSYPSAHFAFRVTNRGSSTLHKIKVGDKLLPGCSHTIGTLAPGKSRSFSCVDALVLRGFTNVAIASGKDAHGTKVSARAKATVKLGLRTKTKASKTTVTKTKSGVTVTTTKTKSGVSVSLSLPDVLFAFNQSILRPGASRALATVLTLLTGRYHTGHLTVTGYTDDIGSVAYNLVLSEARATTVTGWLEQHGIPAGRITIAWKGEADPVASNKTVQGRQRNRRVTITLRSGVR
jgi:outer membrane protein OmpA-like peptidoglycan-associated protein